jgi:hypothetical protein
LAFWDDSAKPDMAAGPSLLRQDGGGGGLKTGFGPGSDADQILTAWARVPPEVEANSGNYYSRVEYSTWRHYASWYATAAWFPAPYTEAGGAFWSGLFRTSEDVSSEFYAVSNGITRVSGTALTLLLFPWSASTTLSMTLGGGAVLWGLDQTVTGGYELATGQEHHTFGGQALSKVFGETAGNLLYDWGPPTTASLNALRNAASWFKNILRNPSKLADEVVDLADESVAPTSVSNPLRAGVEFEAQQLAELGLPKNTTVWRPTIEQTQSAAFKVIVGEAKYTKGGLLKGSILDATETGLLEIKGGRSVLDSTYQLRLQTYRSLIESQPYTIRTTRPINPPFRDLLQRWGVKVEGIE